MNSIDVHDLSILIRNSPHLIEAAWLTEVRARIARSRQLADVQLAGPIEKYLVAVSNALMMDRSPVALSGVLSAAREHGAGRLRMGFTADELNVEYTQLREIIASIAASRALMSPDVLTTLIEINDAGLRTALEAFKADTPTATPH